MNFNLKKSKVLKLTRMKFDKFFTNTKSFIALAYPILIAQLIQNLMGFVDTVMSGRVSTADMAAVAIGSSVWLPVILAAYGLLMALTSIGAQYFGAKEYTKIINATYQSTWIAISLGVLLIIAFISLIPIIQPMVNLNGNYKALLFDYLYYVVWGAPGFCLFLVLRNYAECMSLTKPAMIISIIGLIINIPANYIFIYGKLGMPALGGAGCGVATAIVYWVMFFAMLFYVGINKQLKKINLYKKVYRFDLKEVTHILKVGIPISLSLLIEVSLFSVVAILLAPLGEDIVASHQIALNFSGLVFMVPLSFAMAVTIKVGFAIGNKELQQAKELTRHAIIFGLLVAVITALVTLTFSKSIARIYSTDIDVVNIAASLMLLAAIFQFSDAIQVMSAGALRAYKDTKAILIITFVSFWIIGLSIGYLLGLTDYLIPRLNAAGFWWGFIIGLTTAAVLLTLRLNVIQKRALASLSNR